MNKFDTIFNAAAQAADINWIFSYDNADRNLKIDGEIFDYPCIIRMFREPVQPLFDSRENVERGLSLYIVHVGFEDATSEEINEHLDEIMAKFVLWREAMRRAGVEITINGRPFPAWELTDLDEYGYVYDLTAKYSTCQS